MAQGQNPSLGKKLLEAEDELTENLLLQVSESVKYNTLELLATDLQATETQYIDIVHAWPNNPKIQKFKVRIHWRIPVGVQILSISCSFWENLAKSYVGAPPEGWRPHLGEILDPPLRICCLFTSTYFSIYFLSTCDGCVIWYLRWTDRPHTEN